MSNFAIPAWHPTERVVRAATYLDDHFGPHRYGVLFSGDEKVYRPEEAQIPLDIVFVPRVPE